MAVRQLDDEKLVIARGEPAVCVPVYGAYDMFVQCVRAILAHTAADVPVLIADDGSPDPAVRGFLDEVSQAFPERELFYTRQAERRGFVFNANHIFEVVSPGDVVLVNSDCMVTPGWLEGLRSAAYSDTRVATASAITNSGTILSVPHRNRPTLLSQDWATDEAAAAIQAASLRLRPQIPTAIGHCVYIRRLALDAVGYFDDAFSPGYEEEVDFSQRCVRMGFSHVAADDVFVLHYGGSSFGGGALSAVGSKHHRIIEARYPYYDPWVQEVEEDCHAPLARAIGTASRALRGLSVTVDGRILTRFVTGSQVHTLEVIHALHKLGSQLRLRVIVPPDLGEYARLALGRLDGVEMVSAADLHAGLEPTDVVHRPYQVSSPEDLELFRRAGDRLVITWQDLIAFNNPAYFPSYADWRSYRRLAQASLAVADQVAFFSEHPRNEAVAAQLVEPARAHVAYLGTDHQLAQLRPEPQAPRGSEGLEDRPFLLCIGTDYRHKHRLFALKLLAALRDRHGWPGRLVFAGARVRYGSSAGEEAAFLATNPALAEHVVDLAAVEEAGKEWLLRRTAGLLYPTLYEGFGLVPFEAAEAKVPCFFSGQTSLRDLFPEHLGRLVPWDADASADQVIEVLDDPRQAELLVSGIAAVGARLTWSHTASRLMDIYDRAVSTPPPAAVSIAATSLKLQSSLASEREARRSLESALAEARDQIPDVDPIDAELISPTSRVPYPLRRALVGIGYRRWLRVPIYGPLLAAYRLAYLLRHGSRAPRARDGDQTAASARHG